MYPEFSRPSFFSTLYLLCFEFKFFLSFLPLSKYVPTVEGARNSNEPKLKLLF